MDQREDIYATFMAHRVEHRVEHPPGPFEHLKPFGYAPGGYFFECHDCGVVPFNRSPIGAKRSWRCEPHAQTAYEQAMIRPSRNPTLEEKMCRPIHGRKGHFMRLASGTKFWPLDPRPEEIFIDDIASALSKLCRFNGHPMGDRFYSVAEHSYWCSFQVPHQDALEALLHDASEAYTGDLIRPLKIIPEIAAVYKPIEERNEEALAVRFDLRFPYPTSVKEADEAMCTRELRTIMAGAEERAENQAVCNTMREAQVNLACWAPREARMWFLDRFFQLAAEWPDLHGRNFLSPMAKLRGAA